MSLKAAELEALRPISAGAAFMTEGAIEYVYLPCLKVTVGQDIRVMDGLLCPTQTAGYSTRLYLSAAVNERQSNWQTVILFGRSWHTWSWNNVPANIPLVQMVLEHLVALR